MAPPVKQAAPDTLPADFFDKQGGGAAPDTLPGDFNFGDTPNTPPEQPTQDWLAHAMGQKDETGLEKFLQPEMHDPSKGIWANAKTALSNIGAGGIHALTHPEELVTGAIEQSPPVQAFNSVRDALKHWQGQPNETDQEAAHPFENAEQAVGAAGALATPELGGEVLAKIPSKARAGSVFQSVMNDAADQPVSMTRSMEPLERIQQLSERGGTGVKAADQLYKRINTVNPLNYREARDFASNISRLSAAEKMGLSPTMKAEVGKLSKAFNSDIGDTAASVGRGEDYANAMKEYARASRNAEMMKSGARFALKRLLPAGGAYAAYEAIK